MTQVIILIEDGNCQTIYTDNPDIEVTAVYRDHECVPDYGVLVPEVCDMSQVGEEVKERIKRIRKDRGI